MERQRTMHEQWDLEDIDLEDVFLADGSDGADEGEDREAAADGWADGPRILMMTPGELGRLGEAVAGIFLTHAGYEIIEHGYRCPEGEADYIVYDPVEECTVLVEVKTRRARRLPVASYPEEAVDARKQRRYRRIAACYLMDNFPVPAIRFDVVGITFVGSRIVDIVQRYEAFDWECER